MEKDEVKGDVDWKKEELNKRTLLLSAKGAMPSPYLSPYAVLNKLGLSGYNGECR
jgi:hypothetical protein